MDWRIFQHVIYNFRTLATFDPLFVEGRKRPFCSACLSSFSRRFRCSIRGNRKQMMMTHESRPAIHVSFSHTPSYPALDFPFFRVPPFFPRHTTFALMATKASFCRDGRSSFCLLCRVLRDLLTGRLLRGKVLSLVVMCVWMLCFLLTSERESNSVSEFGGRNRCSLATKRGFQCSLHSTDHTMGRESEWEADQNSAAAVPVSRACSGLRVVARRRTLREGRQSRKSSRFRGISCSRPSVHPFLLPVVFGV